MKFIINACICAYFEDLVILNNYRGKGYGKLLTQTALKYCKAKKCHRLIGVCDTENLGFYTHCGFEQDKGGVPFKIHY